MKNWLNKYQDAGEVIYVDDPNDPRLLDYQTRMNLWKYSQIPNVYHKDQLDLDAILSGVYNQEKLTRDWISDRYNPTAYDTDMYGPYGSKNEIRDIPLNQLDAFRNNPELARRADIDSSFYTKEGKDILKKYPPSRYRGIYEYTNWPYQDLYPHRGDQFFGTKKYMVAPQTQFIEDNIDRALLRKTYPNLTDEFVDEYVQGERENPTYYTNEWDNHPNYQWYSYDGVDSPTMSPNSASGSTMIDTVNGLYPKTYNISYSRYGDYDLNGDLIKRTAKGYLQEGVTHDIERYGKYYPIWDKPTQTFELRKPAPKPPKPDGEIIQVGDSPYEKGSRKSYKAVQDKHPGMGTHEYATTVRIGTDMYPVTHSGDKPYGEFEVNGKKQYITYEKNPEGGYTPAISETQPSSRKVVKAPEFQKGGLANRADSLEVLNNTKQLEDYFKSYLFRQRVPVEKNNDWINILDNHRNTFGSISVRNTPQGTRPVRLDEYYRPIDKNKFYQMEMADATLDTRAPMSLFDRRIRPQEKLSVAYNNPKDPMHGNYTTIYKYDPLAITPWDMLSDADKKLRLQKYGLPEAATPKRSPVPEKIKTKDIQLLQGPEDRLVHEYTTQELNPKYKRVYDKSPYSVKEYGPEGKPTHWAKADEKISGVWRPVNGTPSDVYINKKVKFKSGGWLDTYESNTPAWSKNPEGNWVFKAQKGGFHQKVYNNLEEFTRANKAYNDSLDLYTKSFDFHNKHIPTDNYNSFSVPYDDVYWTADGPGGYFTDTPSGRWFLGKTGVFSWPGSEYNKIFTESFTNKIKPIGFDAVDYPYPVYKKPTQQPVYEEIKNLPYLDAKFERPDFKLDIGKPAVKSQGIRIRPMMTADQNTKTGQYQSGKYMWDPQTKSWKVQMFSPETQEDNREEVRIGIKKYGGWQQQYQDAGQVKANIPGYVPEVGPTVKNAQLLQQQKLQEAARNSPSLNLPTGTINPAMGPVEYILMPSATASIIKAGMTKNSPVDAELEAIRKILRKNVTYPKQTGPLTETPPWPNRFLDLGDDAWVIGDMEHGRTSVENPDKLLPGNLPKKTPKQLPGVNGTQYPNRLPKQKDGGWLNRYQDGSQVPANLPWINQQGQFTQVPVVTPKRKSIEQRVDEALGNPQKKAHELASWAAGSDNPGEEIDNLRHASAAMYATNNLGSSPEAAIAANLLGNAHEVFSLPSMIKHDGFYHALRSSAEDMFNNSVGSAVGMIPSWILPESSKESLLIYLSDNNMLPDGVSMAKGDMYWKKKSGGESQGEGYYDYINGYSGIFAKGGSKGWLDNYK